MASNVGSPPDRTPVRWAFLAVNHTKKTCLIAYIFPILCIAVIAFSRQFSFDEPDGVDFFIRNDEITRLHDARQAAREQYVFDSSESVVERGKQRLNFDVSLVFRGKLPPEFELPSNAEQKRSATNVLTRRNLAVLKRIEDDILNDAEYPSYCFFDDAEKDCKGKQLACAPPLSLLNSPFLYGEWEGDSFCGRTNTDELPSEDQFSSFLESLLEKDSNGNVTVNPQYSELVGKDFMLRANSTWLMRSVLRIGGPFTNFTSIEDRRSEQEDQYIQWGLGQIDEVEAFSTEEQHVTLTSTKLGNAAFSGIALRDLSFCVVAIALVFLVIWFHTGSGFLALAAMGQVFLSFPIAYVIYRFVFQQKYFAALQILSIFLLLGIGADDVFVFTDAWKQSLVDLGTEADAIARMDWTYRRAVKAMTVTSVTTAAAFFVTATSPIMPISTLGVWAGLLVLAQFALVITAYPSAIILWHRFWSQRGCLPCFKKSDSERSSMPFYFKFLPGQWQKKNDTAGLHYSFLERFFGGPWTKAINRLRYGLVIVALALSAVGIYGATKLQPIQEAEQFLPSDHPLRVLQSTIANDFADEQSRRTLETRLTWGIAGIDRSGTSRFEPESLGTAVLDESFDLRKKEAQQHMLNTCRSLASREGFVSDQVDAQDAVDCWVADYEQWRKQHGDEDEKGLKTFDTQQELADDVQQFAQYTLGNGSTPYKRYLQSQAIGLSKKRDRVVFSEIRFKTATKIVLTAKSMRPVYDAWKAATDEVNDKAPAQARSAIVTGGFDGDVEAGISVWAWMRSQETLVRSMFTGIGIMLAVAFVTLTVCTQNWVISLMATGCIGGIVGMLLGMIYALGWELGTTETIGVVISIGYSFDGVAHIATAYVECGKEERYERTRYALLTLGVSIWFGCLSTLIAALLLFPAIITFFVKFAGLLISTVVLSMVWSLALFPALLLVVGPEREVGSLRWVGRRVRAMCGGGKGENVRDDVEKGEEEREETWSERAEM